MSAMKLIEEAKGNGNKIDSFVSFCGGLPAPEFSDGLLGYKFSCVLRLRPSTSKPYFESTKFCREPVLRIRTTTDEFKSIDGVHEESSPPR